MYATYEDYTGAYCGRSIPTEDWPRLERRAAAYIDEITYGRLKHGPDPPPEEVRLAVCAVAEIMREEETTVKAARQNAGVKSFSNDGYSETLAEVSDVRKQYAAEKRKAAGIYLPLSHPLRYAGVDA